MAQQKPVVEKMTTIGEGGRRFWLYPATFQGLWLKRRRIVAYILILAFFITPWTKVGGHQTFLMDLVERKFALFGFVFWPQDTLIFWFFLVGALVAIFLITAQWGRLWCGWACPQTVFLEHVFRRIETWIEGDAAKRRKLDQGPMTWEKIRKKALKYFVFLLISSHFANTVLCYFAGTDRVIQMTFHSPTTNWGWFTFMAFFNFMFFLDFVWFREQFCLIACPYGRFQSALLDEHSLIVGYDYTRGEPRGILRKGADRAGKGDCIDCSRCVAVCPTGIDIRQGLQMECVNCTACIDACDEVMTKVHKPKGLIRYTSIANLEGRKRRAVRLRTLGYALLLVVLWTTGGYLLLNKRDLNLQIIRPPGDSFTLSEDRDVITNRFQVKAVNKSDRSWQLTAKAPSGYEIIAAFNPWHVEPQRTMQNQVFVRRSRGQFSKTGKEPVRIAFYDGDRLVFDSEITLMGPTQ